MNGAWWIEAMHPEGFEVSIAEVRQGCDEADDISTVEANAALIAAAPTLLAILKAAAEDDVVQWHDGPLLKAARAAIAKAEGRR